MNTTPDFVIAGFPKSGTAALAGRLRRMPEKEFFTKGNEARPTFLFKSLKSRFIQNAGCVSKIILDARTICSVFPEGLDRIANLKGQAYQEPKSTPISSESIPLKVI